MADHQVKAADAEKTSKDYYFDSYSHFGIHEEMLKDKVRTNAYRWAIEKNPHLFKDKVVLDVGCGTGILSMFAARAGAKRVVGIDCADIVLKAREIVKENGLEDVVSIVQGKVEDVELPHDIKEVDIIISEYMGYFLLYESMLDTVIVARDRWLKEGGLIFPDKATMYVCGIEDGEYKEEKVGFWDDVYGFKMTTMKPLVTTEPLVDYVEHTAIVTDVCPIIEFDLLTMTKDDVHFKVPYQLTALRDDYIHAIVGFFDVTFSACHKPIVLSTGPMNQQTHWKQCVFYTDDVMTISHGEEVTGEISLARNEGNHRDLDINLSYKWDGRLGSATCATNYRLR